MAYQDRYLEFLEMIPERIRRCHQTNGQSVLAYSSNLDAVLKWNVDNFNRLLDDYLKEEPSFRQEESIDSMEDFARIVSYFAMNGYGGEVDITSREVVDTLGSYFEMEYGIGGTCAQGARALGKMEFPVLVHLTDCSKEVIEDWLNLAQICAVKNEEKVSLAECISDDKPLIHMIVQYTKGDIIRANAKTYEVPLSNRLIMGFDQVHKVLPIEKDFLRYCEEHAKNMYSYNVSGFNAMLDIDILKEKLTELVEHFQKVKVRNPACMIYLESAHYISSAIREYTYSMLAGSIDILGMNEEELVNLTSELDEEVDVENLHSVLKGVECLLNKYPIRGIVVHSKDYALYVGENIPGLHLEMGMTLGNLMSATKARMGVPGSMQECKETLTLPFSKIGMAYASELEKIEIKDKKVILVPSRYMETPKSTIGLGDTFVAGMQIGFIQ
jgi:Archaeal ADP-dependent phosphofructokinase/glucokinase